MYKYGSDEPESSGCRLHDQVLRSGMFNIHSSTGSLVITIKLKRSFHVAVMLFYILHTYMKLQ